jgi:predicted N-acyltransferase
MEGLEISFEPSMASIARDEWDALASSYANPLLSWGFLALLEESGSMTPETGWAPAHALLRSKGELVAAAPLYVKTHSWGEFVFDFELAEVAERLGSPWYPKLVGVIPATPAPAWRVLVRGEDRGSDRELALSRAVIASAAEAAQAAGLSGLHLLWPDPSAAEIAKDTPLPRGSFAEWEHQAFLWEDSGYGDFSGYLDAFSKNMRRNVKREREAVREAGISTRMIGPKEASLHPGLLEAMADLYESHNDKFGPMAARFLERDFFLRLPEFMEGGWAIAAAYENRGDAYDGRAAEEDGAEPIALAFFLEGSDRLYGRFYGARREVPCLHFELCYYLPIEYALGKGLGSFDPGMGSPHKARRGFASISAPSFHLAFDERSQAFVRRALRAYSAEESASIGELNDELPFKKAQG